MYTTPKPLCVSVYEYCLNDCNFMDFSLILANIDHIHVWHTFCLNSIPYKHTYKHTAKSSVLVNLLLRHITHTRLFLFYLLFRLLWMQLSGLVFFFLFEFSFNPIGRNAYFSNISTINIWINYNHFILNLKYFLLFI